MNNRFDKLVDEAFIDELVNLAPEPVNKEKIAKNVFTKLNLPEACEEPAETERTEPAGKMITLPSQKKMGRKRIRLLLVAAVLLILCAMGVQAAGEFLKQSRNDIKYFAGAGSGVQSAVSDTDGNAASNTHDTKEPVFHQGLDTIIQDLNTPVGQSLSYGGVTITLDTIAVDSNFANVFFTAEYDKPIDFETIFPDSFPGKSYEDGIYPDYSQLMTFAPNAWLNIDADAQPGTFWASSWDGYFVDDRTIRFSYRYILPDTYPDEITAYIRMYSVRNADGDELLGQTDVTLDGNPFTFQVFLDKAAENPYCKTVQPGDYVFRTKNGAETLSLQKLMISPFGTVMGYAVEQDETTERARIIGMQADYLYMEDNLGNVVDLYINPVLGRPMANGMHMVELLYVSPEAQSLTLIPLTENPGGVSESREYHVEGIAGQILETSSLGGYTVKDYRVTDGSIEIDLEPYGRASIAAAGGSLSFNTEDLITMAGSRSGMIREQYNRETNILTYAVDYYAATQEELKNVKTFTLYYNDMFELDREAAVTLPLTPVP